MRKIFLVNQIAIPWDDRILSSIREYFTLTDDPSDAEMILVLGGDGAMLKAIRTYREHRRMFSGLNYGHIGFLMNKANETSLEELSRNEMVVISVNVLQAQLYDSKRQLIGKEYAFNDFYFERSSPQTAKIRVTVNDKVRFDPLIGDGVIVCTSAGSTAYNASAGGVILPIGSNNMVLTGICPAVFHRWRTSLLSMETRVILEPIEPNKRPVRFVVDGLIKENVARAKITYSDQIVKVAFALSQDFREKVMNLQFEMQYDTP